MPTPNIDDLFLHELQETHAAETLIGAVFAKAPTAWRAETEPLLAYAAATPQRLERLERIFELIGRRPDPARRPALVGTLGDIGGLLDAAGPATDTRAAALRSVLQTAQYYVEARYVTLAKWAALLGKPEVEQLLAAQRERKPAAAAPADDPTAGQRDKALGVSMGDRLTALFDRKR